MMNDSLDDLLEEYKRRYAELAKYKTKISVEGYKRMTGLIDYYLDQDVMELMNSDDRDIKNDRASHLKEQRRAKEVPKYRRHWLFFWKKISNDAAALLDVQAAQASERVFAEDRARIEQEAQFFEREATEEAVDEIERKTSDMGTTEEVKKTADREKAKEDANTGVSTGQERAAGKST